MLEDRKRINPHLEEFIGVFQIFQSLPMSFTVTITIDDQTIKVFKKCSEGSKKNILFSLLLLLTILFSLAFLSTLFILHYIYLKLLKEHIDLRYMHICIFFLRFLKI